MAGHGKTSDGFLWKYRGLPPRVVFPLPVRGESESGKCIIEKNGGEIKQKAEKTGKKSSREARGRALPAAFPQDIGSFIYNQPGQQIDLLLFCQMRILGKAVRKLPGQIRTG